MVQVWPVPEDMASDDIKEVYRDIRESLEIPWTPSIFQAFATYPAFLKFVWGQLRQSTLTGQFHADANTAGKIARTVVEQAHRVRYKHEDALKNDLSVADLVHVQTTLEALEYGDAKVLIIAAALHRALEDETVGGNGDAALAHGGFGSGVVQKIAVEPVEEGKAPPEVREIYDDMKQAFNVSMINTNYKALANWPGFLKLAWEDQKKFIADPQYPLAVDELRLFGYEAADRLAYPVMIGRERLETAGVDPEDIPKAEELMTLFHAQIPGLLLNVFEMRLVSEDLLEIGRGEFVA